MDRFFARLEVGKVVQRVNWSINTQGTGLFAAFGGLHGHEGEREKVLGVKEVDGDVVCHTCIPPFFFVSPFSVFFSGSGTYTDYV